MAQLKEFYDEMVSKDARKAFDHSPLLGVIGI